MATGGLTFEQALAMLAEHGISEETAREWMLMSTVPKDIVQHYFETAPEISSEGLLRLARELQRRDID